MAKRDPRTPPEPPRTGDEPMEWRRFVEVYDSILGSEVVRALRRLGRAGSADRVDDLKQEIYCRLLEMERRETSAMAPLIEGPRLTAFLQRVVWSVAVDWLRRETAAKRGGDLRFTAPVGEEGECRLDWRPCREPDPEERLLRREEALCARRRIGAHVGSRRPDRDRRIVEMAFLEDRSAKEILGDLDEDLTLSGVYAILRRVRERMTV